MKATLILMLLSLSIQAQTISKGNTLCYINNDEIRAFVSKHWEASEQIYKTHGVPMAISLSQWILESGYGSNDKARNRKNLGGIMTYKNGKKMLKAFDSYKSFYAAYADIFTQDCYRDFQPQNLDEWLICLTWPCCSYHHSDSYTNKMWRIIKLYQFDCLPVNNNYIPLAKLQND